MAAYPSNMTEDIFDPFTSYLQKLGLGTQNYYNPAQQYQMQQFDPLNMMYGLRGRMASVIPPLAPGGTFADYAFPFAGNMSGQGMQNQAKGLLGALMGWNPEQRAQAGAVYEPTYSEGERTGGGNIAELQQLIQQALRGQLGRPGANWLAGNLPAEQQRWAGGQAQGQTGTFLDYIRQKYNLGSFGV